MSSEEDSNNGESKLIGKTLEQANIICQENHIQWDDYYIDSVRAHTIDDVAQKRDPSGRKINNRLNVTVVNGKIDRLLCRG